MPSDRPRLLAALLFLLLLPGTAAALLMPGRLGPWRLILALPMIALPSLLALTRLQPHQRRAAFGLGAGRLDRMRLLWLPQLAPPACASLLLLALFLVAEHRMA